MFRPGWRPGTFSSRKRVWKRFSRPATARSPNRQRAFLDLFNVEHTKALDLISGHGPASQQQADTQAMAEWIAQYRKTMSSEERAALRTRINSASGQSMLKQSTAHFMAQEESVRNAQKPVMMEITATLTSLWKP